MPRLNADSMGGIKEFMKEPSWKEMNPFEDVVSTVAFVHQARQHFSEAAAL